MIYENFTKGNSPVVDEWPLMKSPIPVVSITLFYLVFVLKIGPEWMKNRKAFDLKPILIAYNAYQVIFSAWLCAQAFTVNVSLWDLFALGCKGEISDSKLAISIWGSMWWYVFAKVIDLFDTVFFVMRKKQNQITFLHVYHHASVLLGAWLFLKYLPGEQGIVIGFLNCFVHTIMYFYYLVAALGPQYQKFIWWKKYMTKIQLGQFIIILCYLVALFCMDCKIHRMQTALFVCNTIVFLYLFGQFYIKAYNKKNQLKSEQLAKQKELIMDVNANCVDPKEKKIK